LRAESGQKRERACVADTPRIIASKNQEKNKKKTRKKNTAHTHEININKYNFRLPPLLWANLYN